MKKLMNSLVLSLALLVVSTQKSHAVVGLLLGNPIVSAVGGLATLGGYAVTTHNSGDIASNLRHGFFGLIVAVVGITLLGETQKAEIEFTAIQDSSKFTAEELAVYNSELEELNAINQTIAAEATAHPKTVDVEALWNEYGAVLSPETLKVASYTSYKLIKALK